MSTSTKHDENRSLEEERRMISRERVNRAIHFQGVDHIPHFLPDGRENDLLWLWIPKEPDRQPWKTEDDRYERRIDAWGTTWTRPAGGFQLSA